MPQLSDEVVVTPKLLAALFWEMDACRQADFFAALERLAGVKLCFQMAAVVREIQERADRADHTAQQGFQAMLMRSQAYGESATDYRVWVAKREVDAMVVTARARISTNAKDDAG